MPAPAPQAGEPDAAAVDAFLDEFNRRFTAGEVPAPTYADLSELVENPDVDPVHLARSLARLVHDVRLRIDLRLDGPLKSSIEDEDFTLSSLSLGLQRELAAKILTILRAAAKSASHQALHQHLPGG